MIYRRGRNVRNAFLDVLLNVRNILLNVYNFVFAINKSILSIFYQV